MDIGADIVSNVELHAQHVGKSVGQGIRGFGKEFIKQALGHGNQLPNITDDQVAQMNTDDKAFSDSAYKQQQAQLKAYQASRARVLGMYEEHRAKRMRMEANQKELETFEKQQKMEKLRNKVLNTKQPFQQDIATAVSKGSAETGRNYGAE